MWRIVRTFKEWHPWWAIVGVALIIAGALLGLIIGGTVGLLAGIVVGILAYFFVPHGLRTIIHEETGSTP